MSGTIVPSDRCGYGRFVSGDGRKRRAKAPARSRSLPPRPENLGSHPDERTRTKAEERAVERLRRIVLALPGVTEKIAWGELTWRAGKMFAQMETHHHGAERVAVWLALPPGMQQALVEEDPALFFVPPYVGQKGWVGVRIDGRPDWGTVASVVRDAHRFVT
jgi:hypothetical protein